ncbi:glycosyltransferase family 39 protein, partial [bacterium]|nr:glycosyltransferase family 39 protein [bacterium]
MDFRSQTYFKYLLIFLFIVSIFARFYKAGKIGIWADEGYSAYLAKKSIPQILEYLRSDSGPPLYYILLSLFLKFSDTEFMLRLPSILAGSLCVIMIFFIGKELFDTETGFWSSFFAGLSPLFIFYSQEARNYALLAFLVLCNFYFFIKIRREKRKIFLMGYTLTGVLILYTHNLGIFVLAAALLCGIYAGYYKRKFITGWFIANFLIILSYLPWLSTLAYQTGESQRTIGWIRQFWEDGIYLWAIPQSLLAFCLGGYIPGHV